jgi:hypothetical protein
MRIIHFALLLLALHFAQAQDATPPPRLVRLHFALPPLEGTISLGIYDAQGKLVRVLHREDELSDFTLEHDALATSWDGNDDAGHPLPPGRYRAHGFLVAQVPIEGVDNYFNDWVTGENSPHLTRISRIAAQDTSLQLVATAADGKAVNLLFDPATEQLTPTSVPPPAAPVSSAAMFIEPLDLANGKDATVWAISHVAKGSPEVEIVQITGKSATPAVLRKLSIPADAPQPIALAASPNEELIFLLEKSPALEQVRSLSLQATTAAPEKGEAVSDWKIDFVKKIVAHENFALVEETPVAVPNEHSKAPTTSTQKLRPNPLEQERRGQITLAVGFDEDGSFLKSADGLPLRTISDNGHLKRALIARHGDEAVDVFQDDGAVVEEFRISQLDQMMAFDCGEFDLK